MKRLLNIKIPIHYRLEIWTWELNTDYLIHYRFLFIDKILRIQSGLYVYYLEDFCSEDRANMCIKEFKKVEITLGEWLLSKNICHILYEKLGVKNKYNIFKKYEHHLNSNPTPNEN